MSKAVAVPYAVALIFGIVVIGTIGYLTINQGSKSVGAGSQAEYDALVFSFCQGHRSWDSLFGEQPNCNNPLESTSGGEEPVFVHLDISPPAPIDGA